MRCSLIFIYLFYIHFVTDKLISHVHLGGISGSQIKSLIHNASTTMSVVYAKYELLLFNDKLSGNRKSKVIAAVAVTLIGFLMCLFTAAVNGVRSTSNLNRIYV